VCSVEKAEERERGKIKKKVEKEVVGRWQLGLRCGKK
jgi:hypothetical protein